MVVDRGAYAFKTGTREDFRIVNVGDQETIGGRSGLTEGRQIGEVDGHFGRVAFGGCRWAIRRGWGCEIHGHVCRRVRGDAESVPLCTCREMDRMKEASYKYMYLYLMDGVRLQVASKFEVWRSAAIAGSETRLPFALPALGIPLLRTIIIPFGKVYACDMSSAGSNAGTTSHYEGHSRI